MRWLTCVALFSLLYGSKCQNMSITEEELERVYHEAMTEVLELHADESSKPRSPPYFKMPGDFMHSFVPGTGVGNREELVIDGMFQLPVHENVRFSRLIFKHFNNTDYIAGIWDTYMILMKINKTIGRDLVLSNENIVLTSYAETDESVVKDVVLFTRIDENMEIFSVAVARETHKASFVQIYEVYRDYPTMVGLIDLNIDPSVTSSVKKIGYVQSSHAGSLVILTDRASEKRLNYNHRGQNELNHFIEVNAPSAVDLVTFTVHGHGYIAVADDQFCEIYKMDAIDVKSDILFESLGPFSTIMNLEYFRLGFHHFLAVADVENLHLYTWKKGGFALKQVLRVPNLAQVFAASVETCRDEVVLLTVGWSGDDIGLYVFNSENENFKKIDIAVPVGDVLADSLTSFTSQHDVVILFSHTNQKLGGFVIETSLTSLRDPVLDRGDEVSEKMKKIKDTLESQKNEMGRIKLLLRDAVRSSGSQHITNIQYFDNIIATNGATVENVNEFLIEWEDSVLTLEEYRRGTDDLERTVESLEKLVKEIESKVQDVVRLDEEVVIKGQKTFTGEISAENLVTTSLNLQNVSGIDLPQLQRDIYRLDDPEVIDGTLTFTEPLTVTGNFYIDTTINGIDISEEVMTNDTNQTSNAQMFFTTPLLIEGDLDVSGKVNGIDISEEVVTLDGPQRIGATKNFLNGIEVVDLETELLDGVNIDEFYNKAFTISGNQNVTDAASFSAVTANNIVLKGKLNGYDVKEIADSIVRTDRPANITGVKNFLNDVKIDGELTVSGTINGLKIPDDLVLRDISKTITGTKEFLGEVTANDVIVHGLVDGLKLPDDVITLSKNEEISSTLYFADGIVAERDIVVEGYVDGVDISEIAKQAMKLNESNAFKHAFFLGPVTVTGNLNVNGKINNVDLNKLLDDIVYRDENPIEINVKKTFKKVFADKVTVDHSINGFNIKEDFMTVAGEQHISGKKTFKNTILNEIYVDDGMIDDINITDFYQKRITLEIEDRQQIDREIKFVDNVIVDDLVVKGTINDLWIPDDVVLRNSNQPITNKVFSNLVTVDNLIVDGDITVETLSGLNLEEFDKTRISLSRDSEIPGDIWLGNTTANKVNITGLVNGVNIQDFVNNVMSKSKPHQIVTGIKEFSGNVTIYGDIQTSGVNGYELADINRRAFKLYGNNVVTAPFEFEDNVTLADLTVGEINGVNITRLREDSLKKTGDIQYVKGDVTFEAGFDVLGDVTATKVNDLVLPKDILLNTIPQTIGGHFTFKSLAVNGDLKVKGYINGLNLSEIIPNIAKIDNVETVIESDVTFAGPVHVQENIDVSGKVNNVNLTKLFETVLRKTGDQTITGHKIFYGNVTVTGDIDVAYVNGINWKQFLDDVVWINKPEVIHSSKIFKGDVSVGSMFVQGEVQAQTINGKDLNRFVTDAVFIDEPAHITGPIIFKNPVEISGDFDADLINGLNLKTDVITIRCSDEGPQIITGHKSFQNIKVFGDITADSVNSHDLQQLYNDTLLTVGSQTVTGRKIIYGDVVFKKDVHPDTVNGITLSEDLVTLDTDQTLEGPLIFQGDVSVREDMVIKGLLNGIDLYNLSRDIFDVKSEQVIEGTYTFDNAVVLSNVEVDDLVNGIDLPEFDRNVTDFLRDTKESIAIMEGLTEEQCQIAKYLQESLKGSYYDLDGFILHQDFEFPASFVQVDTDSIALVSVDDSAKSTTSIRLVWDNNSKTFSVFNFTESTVTKSLSYQVGNLDLTVNIGINSKDSSISVLVSGHPVQILSDFADACVLVREEDALIALLSSNKNAVDVYFLKERPQMTYSYELDSSLDLIPNGDSTSIALFELSGRLHLAVSSSHFPFTARIYPRKDNGWALPQHIQASGSFVKYFEYQNYHYLAFANSASGSKIKEPKSIQIYRHSEAYESKFVLFQKVPFDDARGMELFNFGDLMQLHMIAWNEKRISIFGLEGESGMRERFTIYGRCVRDVKPLLMENDLYLVVGRQNLEAGEAVASVLYKAVTKGVKYEPYKLDYCSPHF